MDNNENSVLFSLSNLRQLASAGGGTGALTMTRPVSVGAFVPLGAMTPMALPPHRSWSASWLMPTVLGLGGLLAISLSLLLVVVLRAPAPAARAVAAAAPVVVTPPPAPPAAPVAVPAVPAKPVVPAVVETSVEATPAVAPAKAPAVSKAKVKRARTKLAGRTVRHPARHPRGHTQRGALASRGGGTKKVASHGRRSELDDLLDAAMK
jgi:hypothetical protein